MNWRLVPPRQRLGWVLFVGGFALIMVALTYAALTQWGPIFLALSWPVKMAWAGAVTALGGALLLVDRK